MLFHYFKHLTTCPHADVTAHPRSGRLEWQRASLEGEGDGVEGWDRASSGGLQQRAGVGVDGSALGGAEAASHLSEGGAGAQRPLRAVVGGLEIAVGNEEEEVAAARASVVASCVPLGPREKGRYESEMAASREEVAERVKEVLVEQLGVDANEITEPLVRVTTIADSIEAELLGKDTV